MKAAWTSGMRARLDDIYSRQGRGEDVPPALHLSAEGYAAAGIELGLCDLTELAQMVEQIHLRLCHETVAERTGMDAALWLGADGQLQLPVQQKRAPVYPSTSEDA